MAAEVVMPVIVRIGETEAQWGTITFTADDGPVTEEKILRETAAFLREAADRMDSKAEDEGEVDGAAP